MAYTWDKSIVSKQTIIVQTDFTDITNKANLINTNHCPSHNSSVKSANNSSNRVDYTNHRSSNHGNCSDNYMDR